MNHPKIQLGCVENLFTRMMHFEKAGDTEQGHTHPFDHLSLVASGKIKITVDGQETIFTAPHMVYIHKDKNHELVALEDNTTVCCIHYLGPREDAGNILDDSMIPNGVVVNTEA